MLHKLQTRHKNKYRRMINLIIWATELELNRNGTLAYEDSTAWEHISQQRLELGMVHKWCFVPW